MTRDPYRYFRVEARELVDQLGSGVVELERSTDPELVARLFRWAHTLKGAARVVKQPDIANDAHAIEDALAPARTGESLSRDHIDSILVLLDRIAAAVAGLPIAAPATAPGDPPASPPPALELAVEPADVDELLAAVAEAHAQLAPLRALGGEAGTRADRLQRELATVREAAERLRLVPVSGIFGGLARLARDAAAALDRRISFEPRAADIRLDPRTLAAVHTALVQLVRNAVAHGIEPAAERLAAGKPAAGRVSLQVTRLGDRIVFACTDDGRGVDLAGVRRAAEHKGLSREVVHALDVDALLRLLLGGGISTSAAISDVSGRGVGLDLVRDVTAGLGGEVRITTVPGRGTTVELVVTPSVSAMPVLTVGAGDEVATVPLSAIRSTARVAPDAVSRGEGGEMVVVENRAIPFLPLLRALTGRRLAGRRSQPWSMIVIETGRGAAAIGVDRMLGTTTAVVRPLPSLLPASPIIFGASLDAEGDPVLALDPDELVAAAHRSERGIDDESNPSRLPILVIDDSLTTRMLVQSILESAGYTVELAPSAEHALDRARQRAHSLFLVDVEMPGMDGFTFIERIHADPQLRHIPAILLTSRSSLADRRRGDQVGARGYVVKGEFDQNQLLARIRSLVG